MNAIPINLRLYERVRRIAQEILSSSDDTHRMRLDKDMQLIQRLSDLYEETTRRFAYGCGDMDKLREKLYRIYIAATTVIYGGDGSYYMSPQTHELVIKTLWEGNS
jgi:hypothetical protein